MVRLLIKILFFITTSFVLLNLISFVLVRNNFISKPTIEVYEAIDSSNKRHEGKDVLILGDSVARQLVSIGIKNKAHIIDLSCNMAISLAGQYVLFENVLKNNKQIKTVCILLVPDSFTNNLNQKYTHNYFVKPFYTEYSAYLTKNTIQIVNSKYSKVVAVFDPFFGKLPLSKVLDVTSIDYHDDSSSKHGTHLSPISIEYLTLIQNKCSKLNIKLKIYPLPISVSTYNKIRSLDYFRNQINNNQYNDILGEYINNLVVLDDNFFLKDTVHFKSEYVKFVSDFSLEYVGLNDEVN